MSFFFLSFRIFTFGQFNFYLKNENVVNSKNVHLNSKKVCKFENVHEFKKTIDRAAEGCRGKI